MKQQITLVCEDTFDGIMSAIYEGWILMNKGNEVSIHPGTNYAPTFFSEYRFIETNRERAVRVATSIRKKISVEAYMMVFRACTHFDKDKADAVFGFLQIGYSVGARVVKMLGEPSVMRVMELSRKAVNESHLFKGFIRFTELRGNILYTKIEPKCDVVPLIINHFENRFPEENWIIFDAIRNKSAVHKKNTDTIIIEGQNIEKQVESIKSSSEYEELWKVFFDTIGIEARYNPTCQSNHLPKWFRKNMLEMQ